MRVGVIGAGAIGGVIAAAAADAGHEVELCVRTPFDRLVVERDGQEHSPAVSVVGSPGDLSRHPAEVVWLATKAIDTASAKPWLEALCDPATLVAVAQNGLDQESRAAPLVPANRVVPALAYIGAERTGPGRIRHATGSLLVVPEDVEAQLAATVTEGGMTVRGAADMRSAAWRKLFSNLVANPITALTMRRIPVMREPGIEEVALEILSEALAVARAEGADLSEEDAVSAVRGTFRYGDEVGSSMLYDRMAGRPMEHQYLTGEVVRRAATHGIDVPVNRAVLALLDAIDRGRTAAG